jgi:hypothetical protein
MKKKVYKIVFVTVIALTMLFSFQLNDSYARTKPTPGAYYQTMAYCTPWHLTNACTHTVYADRCSLYVCLLN